MLIKVTGDKYNFIDKNDLFVGYDTATDCCEDADWDILDKPTRYSEMDERHSGEGLEDYVFDTASKVLGIEYTVNTKDLDAGDMAIFRLLHPTKEPLFLHLYNCHNGYYGHMALTNIPGFDTEIVL